jgi:hypothetical protein
VGASHSSRDGWDFPFFFWFLSVRKWNGPDVLYPWTELLAQWLARDKAGAFFYSANCVGKVKMLDATT